MLYPTVTFDPSAASLGPNLLPAGNLAVIPIDMSIVQMTTIIVAQQSFTEDFGMRAWVSIYPGGLSLLWPFPDVFALSRITPRPLVLYVSPQIPPLNMILTPVVPGHYKLNILNLTNSPTLFSFAKIDLA